jgi:poly-gamma-glutamate capsule biosynthesis protein CapA/YwtB (metallophosphatase superfamily)
MAVAIAASGLFVTPARGARGSASPRGAEPTRASGATPLPLSDATSSAGSSSAPVAAAPLTAIVPVASFWTTTRNITMADIIRLWSGRPDVTTETQYRSVVVSTADAAAIADWLNISPADTVQVLSPAAVKDAVRASATTLGLVAVDQVTPDVRALSVNGISLFGSGRIKAISDWPFVVRSAVPSAFATADEWTLAAGGDVNLDRNVYLKAVKWGYGPDYPWSLGYAAIGGYECCGLKGGNPALAYATGGAGELARRFSGADLALANLEGSTPNAFTYRPDSLVFTFDPKLLEGLRDAGIDAVSLANNHIRNGGDSGVVETCVNLDAAGIAHTGAGADVAAARIPAWLSADGLRIAVLAYSAVGPANWATTSHPGAAPLDPDSVTADIRAAKAAGADLVIVMPHWGEEYSYWLSSQQKDEAAQFVAAGADLVLGSHSHWVGAVESIERPQGPAFVDFSLGDLLFDLNHDLQSQEAVVATMTFSGKRLVQVGLDPTIMVDGAQVALLDPAGDGQVVINAIKRASRGMPGW